MMYEFRAKSYLKTLHGSKKQYPQLLIKKIKIKCFYCNPATIFAFYWTKSSKNRLLLLSYEKGQPNPHLRTNRSQTKRAGCIAIRWDETTIKKTLFEIRLHFHSDSFSQLAGKPIAFTSTLGWAFSNAFNCRLKSLSGWVAFCKYAKQQSWA